MVEGEDGEALVPIDAVARRFGIKASAIRYYEQCGILQPVSRHAGRRWYGPTEIRRLAIIHYWQKWGLMSLDEIAEVLAGPGATRDWARIVEARIETLRQHAERMNQAREHLEHVLFHHPDSPPDGCEYFEELLVEPQAERTGSDVGVALQVASRGRGQ